MRKLLVVLVALLAVGMLSSTGQAVVVELREVGYWSGGQPMGTDSSAFDPLTGLGTLRQTITGAGTYYVGLYLDQDIDSAINTFFNEFGATTGVPAAGQSWEIDEPGWVYGNIYDNFLAQALDNSNGVPGAGPDDVAMALAWDFILAADETGVVSFRVGTTAPASGFYLSLIDPESQASIYFSESLEIRGGGEAPVPEPATLLLMGSGLGGLALLRKRMKR